MDYKGEVSTKVPFASVSKWAYVHTIHMTDNFITWWAEYPAS